MIPRCLPHGVFAAALLLLPAPPARSQVVKNDVEVVPFDATWDWLMILGPSGEQLDPASPDGPDPDFLQTWNTPAYDGPAFRPGMAPLSYGGIEFFLANSSTLPGSLLDNPSPVARGTVYFRKTLDLPGQLNNAVLEFLVDDGMILYVDGVPWITHNMPPGATSAFTQMAAGITLNEFQLTTVASGLPSLAPGPHLICASVHNHSVASSDLGFMLRITGDLTLPPPELTSSPTDPSKDGSSRILLSAKHLNPAVSYTPQSSSDLIHWIPLGSFPASQGRTQFTLDVPSAAQRRFFRMVYQDP